MVQKLAFKLIIKQIMKVIEKADDKQIASNHEKRIVALEKKSHTPKDFKCECKCQKK